MNEFNISTLSELSFSETFVNFVLATVFSIMVQFCFRHLSHSPSGRTQVGYSIPIITTTTFLVIIVVKTSLALSLGLVGALSIVRFRTPIKDPETLSYLFLSIGIGLGLGAGQRMPTLVIAACILFLSWLLSLKRRQSDNTNLFLNIGLKKTSKSDAMNTLFSIVQKWSTTSSLTRFDTSTDSAQATFNIELTDVKSLDKLCNEVSTKFRDATITFVDTNTATI